MFIAFNIRSSFRITNLLFSRDTQGSDRNPSVPIKIRFAPPPPLLSRLSAEIGAVLPRQRIFPKESNFQRVALFPLRVPFIDSGEASTAPSSLSLSLSLARSLARSVPPLSPYRRRDPRGQERVYNGLTGYRRGPRIKRATAKRSNRSNTRNKYHVYLSTRPTRIISTCRYALHVDLFHLLHVRYACTFFFFFFFFFFNNLNICEFRNSDR